ncbi:MAG: DUF5672 family protein [Novosphingobium sp.]
MTAYPGDDRLTLPTVTLCAVASVNVAATLRALEACVDRIAFADCKLFTDALVRPRHPEISVVSIDHVGSSAAYSHFLLSQLVGHVETSHALVAQWDGHVLDAVRWRDEFLDYDYIGASWPQFDDGHDVGNGGFSLRSRRLMQACRRQGFSGCHPEDVAIGRINRRWLEGQGLRFAPRELADLFAAERAGDLQASFGYHGVWNMPQALGAETFWQVYHELDDRGTVWTDFRDLLRALLRGSQPIRRGGRLAFDRAAHSIRRLACRAKRSSARSSFVRIGATR